jgi:hypothetical protein
MTILGKISIGLVLLLALVVGLAWMNSAPPREAPTAPEARSSGQSARQLSTAAEPAAKVGDQSTDPPSIGAKSEPAGAAAEPLDLTGHYGMKASSFDGIKQYPWPAVPRGSQTFANVPLEIGGALFLWGERNANNGLRFPEQITDIPVARKFETLYVCHGAFFEGKSGTPIYEVVLRYDDGTTASDTLVCGEDARDWFANRADATLSPSSPRSTLAWDGDGMAGERTQAIRFCLTAIANPFPDQEVQSLDLVSSKSQAAACILAISTGRSGLMKRSEAPPAASERDE